MTDCRHERIEVFRGIDGGPGRMWACYDCHRRFYPACRTCVTVGHRDEQHVEPPLDVGQLARALNRLPSSIGSMYIEEPTPDPTTWKRTPIAAAIAAAYEADHD